MAETSDMTLVSISWYFLQKLGKRFQSRPHLTCFYVLALDISQKCWIHFLESEQLPFKCTQLFIRTCSMSRNIDGRAFLTYPPSYILIGPVYVFNAYPIFSLYYIIVIVWRKFLHYALSSVPTLQYVCWYMRYEI